MRIFVLLICLFITGCSKPNVKQIFENYMWQNNVLIVFAPKANAPEFLEQKKQLRKSTKDLLKHDFVVWEIVHLEHVHVNNEPKPQLWTPPIYDAFNVKKNDFQIILIGKDGHEKLRKEKATPIEQLLKHIK